MLEIELIMIRIDTIIVREAATKEDMEMFINLPYILNTDDKNWVPPLRISQRELLNSQHPFWKRNRHRFFLAFQNNICVGRIAGFEDKDQVLLLAGEDGFFGFLEAIDDLQVFKCLLNAAGEFVKSLGFKSFIGPFNPSIHYELGVLTSGFDSPPYFMLTHNKYYYNENILNSGMQVLKDFYAYKLDTLDFELTDKIIRVKSMLQKKYKLTIRTPDMTKLTEELKIFYDIYNNAFKGHWGFAPISWKEFEFLGRDMKMILDKEMILIIQRDKEPVGFLLALPNLNEVLSRIKDGRLFPFGILKLLWLKRRIRSLRVITIAIKQEYNHLGIGSLLYPEIAQRASLNGYKHSELSWVVNDNVQMNKICHEVGAKPYKNYRIYNKVL